MAVLGAELGTVNIVEPAVLELPVEAPVTSEEVTEEVVAR